MGQPFSDFSIIIPAIRFDKLTQKCVAECLAKYPGAHIQLLLDSGEGAEPIDDRVQVSITGDITIAAKRNLAARQTNAQFLAFIDSDAYPDDGWLEAASKFLSANEQIVAMGGPNLLPPETSDWSEVAVGCALKSYMMSKESVLRKSLRPEKFVNDLPSCNLIVRTSVYLKLGGMNESLFTGEDVDFCAKLAKEKYRIFYTPECRVFHKNRKLRQFFLQRLTYGASVPELVGLNPFTANSVIFSLPFLTLMFLLSFPLGWVFPLWMNLYLFGLTAYCLIVLFEAIRCANSLRQLGWVVWAIVLGNLTPGLGTLLQLVGLMPNRKNIYRNDRERLPE